MLVGSSAKDIVYTAAVSGTLANFLAPSLDRAGYTPEQLVQNGKLPANFTEEAKAWRDVWSAGHGVATIHDVPSVAQLADRLVAEYRAACALPVSPAAAI
jgi:nitronate monooxygenase